MSLLDPTRLAAQYGPFLFAMLFVLVVTRTARIYYRESNVRMPPASEEEKKVYQSYFTTSVWVGIFLTLLSIGWWIYVHLFGPSVYQIAIVGLNSDETILSDYFSKTVPRPTVSGVDTVTDDFFIVAQDRPFKIGDKFKFYYFKTPATPPESVAGVQPEIRKGGQGIPIEIEYSGNMRDIYDIERASNNVSLKLHASDSRTLFVSSLKRVISSTEIDYSYRIIQVGQAER
jgi:hypothetical protein